MVLGDSKTVSGDSEKTSEHSEMTLGHSEIVIEDSKATGHHAHRLPAQGISTTDLAAISPGDDAFPAFLWKLKQPRSYPFDDNNVRLNLAVHCAPPEAPGDRFCREVSCFGQPRGIPCLDLVSQGRSLAVGDRRNPG